MRLERRGVAVVTGASAGVGRATAIAFADHGFDVGLLARGAAGLDGAARDVTARGRRALPVPTDVSQYEQVEAAADRVERELGPIDVWVNDAMTTAFQAVLDTRPEDFARAVEVTFLGQVWGTMVALRRMGPRDRGAIVNVGSALAFLSVPLQAAYCSSKFACRGFSEAVRAELLAADSHVTIGMVHLPAVNTPQFDWCLTDRKRHPEPVMPVYQPEQAAKAILTAALDGRRSKVLGSWNKLVAAAGSLTPGVGNRFAAATAVSSQLADRPVQPDRPANLWAPADDSVDFGAHGSFENLTGGALAPAFLRTLPGSIAALVGAARAVALERVDRQRRRLSSLRARRGAPHRDDAATGRATVSVRTDHRVGHAAAGRSRP